MRTIEMQPRDPVVDESGIHRHVHGVDAQHCWCGPTVTADWQGFVVSVGHRCDPDGSVHEMVGDTAWSVSP